MTRRKDVGDAIGDILSGANDVTTAGRPDVGPIPGVKAKGKNSRLVNGRVRRTVYIDPILWHALTVRAAALDVSASDLLNDAAAAYLGDSVKR